MYVRWLWKSIILPHCYSATPFLFHFSVRNDSSFLKWNYRYGSYEKWHRRNNREREERGFTIQISEPPFLHCNTRRGKTWTLMDRNTRMKKVFKGFFSYMLPYKGFICLKMIGQFMNVRRCINFIIIKSNKIVASLTFFS